MLKGYLATEGFVKMPRNMWSNPAFRNTTEAGHFFWMVSTAVWKPGPIRIGERVIELKRGQLAASYRYIAKAWGWDQSKVRRFINRLKNASLINTQADTGITVITICNYDKFQGSLGNGDTVLPYKVTSQRHSGDTNKEEDKELKNKNARARGGPAARVLPLDKEDVAKYLGDGRYKSLSKDDIEIGIQEALDAGITLEGVYRGSGAMYFKPTQSQDLEATG